jgi:small-conductance mechanosensitive channel
VLVIELGDSAVEFEVAYWSAPDMRSVRLARDEVLRACKSAVEAAGLTIPWPIRTSRRTATRSRSARSRSRRTTAARRQADRR